MAFNTVAFKKTMLTWEGIAKKAPGDITAAGKEFVAEHPEAAQVINTMSQTVSTMNHKLHDQLDRIITAKDDKGRADAAKSALSTVKQYENYVTTTHLPADVQKSLKDGLAQLARGLAG